MTQPNMFFPAGIVLMTVALRTCLQLVRRDDPVLGESPGRRVGIVGMEEPDLDRTETQRECADWAANGYRKLYQPRSVLLLGGVFLALFAVGLVAVFWVATSGRLP